MRLLKDALSEVYQKKSHVYDELHALNIALQQDLTMYSPPVQKLLPHMQIYSFVNDILTLQINKNYFSPELHFFSAELKNSISKKLRKNIKTIRFIEKL